MRASRDLLGGVLFLALTASTVGCAAKQTLPDVPAGVVARDEAKTPSPAHYELVSVHYRIEADGTHTRTLHQRYRILDQRGVEGWAYTEAYYSPWYMDRPEIRATVTSPDGATQALLPSALAEQPAYPNAPDVYGDSLIIRGPLPSVRVGSVIDETIVTRTHRPFFEGGLLGSLTFQAMNPRDRVELVIDAPAGMPIRTEIRDARVTRREETSGGRQRIIFEGGPYAALEAPEDLLPPESAVWPHVAFSTGTSWNRIADAYGRIIDGKLGGVDFGPTVEKIVGPDDSPLVKANKLLSWMKERVRYAAVEFGESSITPADPVTTMSRGYGDCKDQATLLVGLLRATGLDAHVALLQSGTGQDILPSLPAPNGFSHAIVVVEADPAIWIDPTATYVRAGELPVADQNRLVLIADSSTSELVRSPTAAPADNIYRERRVVHLAEFGESNVVETSTGTGYLERWLRENFSGPRKETEENLEKYIEKTYGSEDLSHLKITTAEDLGTPFELALQANETNTAFTDLLTADAYLGFGPVLGWLPEALYDDEEERQSDLVLPIPYRAELTWQVKPPPGFALVSPPRSYEEQLGPSRLTREVSTTTDGGVDVRYVFDAGKARYTVEDVKAFRDAYKKLQNKPAALARFAHGAQRLLEAGKPREAVQLLRSQIAEEPRSPLGHLRLAWTLSDLGLGKAARKVARAAVAAAPNDPVAYRVLGHILARDEMGRDLHAGFDRQGAIDAYRTAASLDEDDFYSALRVGVLLEYDDDGERYGAKDLQKACAHYGGLDEEKLRTFDGGTFANNRFICLMNAEQYDTLAKELDSTPQANIPVVPAVVGAAATGGTTGARGEVERLGLSGEQKRSALAAASGLLARRRDYVGAAELLEEAHADGGNTVQIQARARVLRRLRQVAAQDLPQRTPEDVLRKVLVTFMLNDPEEAEKVAAPLLSLRIRPAKGDSDVIKVLSAWDTTKSWSRYVTPELLTDMFVGGFESTKVGDDKVGYRIRATVDLGTGPKQFHAFLIKEHGQYQLRAFGDHLGELGAEALTAHRAGDAARAKQWLDWARELAGTGRGKDPLRLSPFLRLWGKGQSDVELAAAALATWGAHAATAVPILEKHLATAKDAEQKQIIQHALAWAYTNLERSEDQLKTGRALWADLPDSDIARSYVLGALWSLERWDAREALLEAEIKTADPEKRPWLVSQLASTQARAGRVKDARATRQALIDEGKAGRSEYNSQAWDGLFVGVSEKDLDLALRAVQMGNNRDPVSLHTLACIYADLGRLNDAKRTLEQLLELRKGGEPMSVDWYVIGRMAEWLSLKEDAKAAYQRVEKPEIVGPTSTYTLAQTRLRKL